MGGPTQPRQGGLIKPTCKAVPPRLACSPEKDIIMNITVLGLGAMGSRMAANLIKANHTVTVWNRDAKKADPLLALGAKLGNTPKAAAQSADMVISMVRDNEASQHIWTGTDGAFAGMCKGALAIECSTLTAAHMKSHNTPSALSMPLSQVHARKPKPHNSSSLQAVQQKTSPKQNPF
jgi:D-arabinose 1-dehydrogenase-like Zn-dependent alcohol dehydrogenase